MCWARTTSCSPRPRWRPSARSRLIFSSSDQVYPTRFARYRPTDELHPREPYTFYGLSKLLGEEMVKFYGRSEKNLATSIAVFSNGQVRRMN